MDAEAMLSRAIRYEQMEHEEQEVHPYDDEMQDYPVGQEDGGASGNDCDNAVTDEKKHTQEMQHLKSYARPTCTGHMMDLLTTIHCLVNSSGRVGIRVDTKVAILCSLRHLWRDCPWGRRETGHEVQPKVLKITYILSE